jgi:desampylase
MAITISRALHAELLALAAAEPGREVCGLLFGTEDRIEAIQPCVNVSASPADSFEIDPAALIAAHKVQRAGGRKVIGCYHSHPNGRGEPSERDVAGAHTEMPLWVIIVRARLALWQCEDGAFRRRQRRLIW